MRQLPVAFILLVLTLAGCRPELETQYGQRKGPMARSSVNGTAALGEIFEQKGHTVFSWNSLSPKLRRRAEVIVWFPDDFQPPSADVRRWLENWLLSGSDRTLIYVGRDFDAASWYWNAALAKAPASQVNEFRTERANAKSRFLIQRSAIPKSEDCKWFTLDGRAKPRLVRSLQGEPEWTQGIDPSKVAIELNSRIVPPKGAETLLESEQDVLVSRQLWDKSQMIVVANGSFLLNTMLVNHEHRKLASQLIAEVGPSPKTVVFLESYGGGPPIRDDDSFPAMPTGMEIFHVWPTNWILLHLAVVGIIFCFARYPIFGRPREPQPEDRSDFGRHIHALGEMLERSNDAGYAYERLLHYRQKKSEVGTRKPGKSKPSSPPTLNSEP